jgi:hypothetical protein
VNLSYQPIIVYATFHIATSQSFEKKNHMQLSHELSKQKFYVHIALTNVTFDCVSFAKTYELFVLNFFAGFRHRKFQWYLVHAEV